MILHGGRASNIKKGVGKPRLQVVGRLVRGAQGRKADVCGKDGRCEREKGGGLVVEVLVGKKKKERERRMSQSIVMEDEEGGCLAIPVRLLVC